MISFRQTYRHYDMDMQGKTAIITGATSGIGWITALAVAGEGAHLVLPVRNMDKGRALRGEIREKTGNTNVALHECRLDSFASIRAFAEAFLSGHGQLHLLVNNAGIWETKRSLSLDGIEMNFAVNHLAPFLLTNLLLDPIRESAPSRIVNVSSMAHKQATMRFDDLEGKKHWSSMRSYAQGKLANIMFTRKLAADLKDEGVTVNCLHPGVVNTRLFDKMPWPFRKLFGLFMISPRKGAQTTVHLATSPDVQNITGEYFVKKRVAKTSRHAADMDAAQRLWDVSLAYCGLAKDGAK